MSNVVNYFEIGTPDAAATTAFYGDLFGWQIGEPSDTGYRMVDGDKGGIWDSTNIGGGSWAIFSANAVCSSVNSTRKRRPVNTIQRSFGVSTYRLITDSGAPPTVATK